MNIKILSLTAALTGAITLTGCSGFPGGSGNETPSESATVTETTTVPPTTSIYNESNTVHYEAPDESQRSVSWDITLNKLEIRKYLKPLDIADDDYANRITPPGGSGNRYAELELTLKNTGHTKQSYITYESADVFTELLWEGNSYYPTYITNSPDGYPNKPIISYVDIEPGETDTVRIAFEVPKELGESDAPLRYHLFYKNGNGADGVYIDLR